MNGYGNKVGCHTPNETEIFLDKINSKTNLEWSDSSWHNDTCDSVEHHIVEGVEFVSIFIPNSDKHDISNEEWNTYTVCNDKQEYILESASADEVIKFINENY